MVKLAAINLEGRALQWHPNWVKYNKRTTNVSWKDYVQVLEGRFGDLNVGDPMAELLALKQSGTISQFYDKFEFYLGRVDLTEECAISFFLIGLKPVIQQQVCMFMPKTLNQACTLAQLQETSLKTLEEFLSSQKKPHVLPYPNPQLKFLPRTNMTPNYPKPLPRTNRPFNNTNNSRMKSSFEFDENRAKEVCFWYNEKYGLGHKCK